MRETAIFFAYLVLCLLLAALLTVPVMQAALVDYPPQRVMGRLAQVFILLGIWPLLKAVGSDNRQALGYGASGALLLRAVWRGWLAGVAILVVLAVTLVVLQVRVPDMLDQGWLVALLGKALRALIGGLLVGLMEETFFRGALYSAIRRRRSMASAVVWTATLYVLVHFMKPHALPDSVPFDWAGSWQMVGHVFTGVLQWEHVDSMAALFLVGVFLALVRERTGHIGWCIGLHAGWVFVIQITRHVTDTNVSSAYAFLVGDYDGMIGWLAVGWIGVLVPTFWFFSQRGTERPRKAQSGRV